MGSYQQFTNKPSVSNGDALNPTTQINNPAQGIQDEFELRSGDGWIDGIVSGLRPVTTNGTSSVTVPSGRAYAVGKQYVGNETKTMTGNSSGSYTLYYDSADDTTTLKAKTSALGAGELQLATFTWDGLGTSSTSLVLTDNGTGSKHGVYRYARDCQFAGQVATTSRYILPIFEDSWVERVDSVLVNNGTSGNTTFDVLLGADGAEGTSIFTTTTRRPTHAALGNSYDISNSGEPDGDRFPDAGEHLTVKPVEVFGTGTASEATVTVWLRPR
jgi:hypothetical protein